MNTTLINEFYAARLNNDVDALIRVKSKVVDLMGGSTYDNDALIDFYCDVRDAISQINN